MSELRRSGLYAATVSRYHIECRLDVDGPFTQNQVSVSLVGATPVHLIAAVEPLTDDIWQGPVWFRFPQDAFFPLAEEEPDGIQIARFHGEDETFVTCSFLRGGNPLVAVRLDWQAGSFRELELELDYEQGVEVVTRLDLLPFRETTVQQRGTVIEVGQVFSESGLDVRYTTEANLVPRECAGGDRAWSAGELNDAMVHAWSRSENPAWSIWAFSAGRYADQPGRFTFGIMFDVDGAYQRNGCAVFHKTIDQYYQSRSVAERRRIKFRTLIHEIGHSLNLAHSWEKTLGRPWHPAVQNEPADAGFMNYPRYYPLGGASGYWRDFQYRFSDKELVFLRHAPDAFVKPSGAAWFVGHGARTLSRSLVGTVAGRRYRAHDFSLTVRVHRPAAVFEFMEDVRVELKLTNHGRYPRFVPVDALVGNHHLHVDVARLGCATRPVKPFFQTCHEAELLPLGPGESFYASLPIARGVGGWMIDEPGDYRAVVSLDFIAFSIQDEALPVHLDAAFDFRVIPPPPNQRREAYRFAQEYFHEDVARTFAVGGSRALTHVNDLFAEMTGRFPAAAAAVQARWTSAAPLIQPFQTLQQVGGVRQVTVEEPNLKVADAVVSELLAGEAGVAAAGALGHIDFGRMCLKLKDQFEAQGRLIEALDCFNHFECVLKARGVTKPASLEAELQQVRHELDFKNKHKA